MPGLKRYYVDVSQFPADKKETVLAQLKSASFHVDCKWGTHGIEGLIVYWERPEEFMLSPVCPRTCPVQKL